MRRLLFALCLLACPLLHGATDDQILAAIRQVEGVRDPAKPGPAGELGFYHMTPGAWSQHTTKPFSLAATDPAIEAAVARQHVRWLREHLDYPSAYRIALAWNAGLSAVNRGTAPPSARSYAQRVTNLINDTNP